MKKVKILNSICGANFNFSAGQVVEITEEMYKGIRAHCAVIEEAEKPKAKNVRKL